MIRLIPMWCTCLLIGCGGDPTTSPAFTVAAAASLAPVIDAALERWPGPPGRASYAASSTLARQIAHGADYDLYIAADRRWMHHLAGDGAIDTDSLRVLAGNALVLVRPAALPGVPADAVPSTAPDGRWTTGDPAHVPLGRYARAALGGLGWWEACAPRLIDAADARAALRLVARGAVDWGVVYRSDAGTSDAVRIVRPIPAHHHPPIAYPGALLAGADPAAAAFLAWLRGENGQALFAAHGLTTASPTTAVQGMP